MSPPGSRFMWYTLYMGKLSVKLILLALVAFVLFGQTAEAAMPAWQVNACAPFAGQLAKMQNCCASECDCVINKAPEKSEAILPGFALRVQEARATVFTESMMDEILSTSFDRPALELSPPSLSIYQQVSSYRL